MSDESTDVRLHFSTLLALRMLLSLISGKRRDFNADARTALFHNTGKVAFTDLSNIPSRGPFLVALNHYTRPGLPVIWAALAVSSRLPATPLWLMTRAWTKRQPGWDALITRLTELIFARVARMYGFISMPPMPPVSDEMADRALSIRRLMITLREQPDAILCMAPEGQDFPGGVLGQPPAGTGKLILHLARRLQRILPVGVYEDAGQLVVHFGATFELDPHDQAENADTAATAALMHAIADLLPAALRGAYSQPGGETA